MVPVVNMHRHGVFVSILYLTNVILCENNDFYFDGKPIVHLFEWKWVDIERECEFLQKKGYGGIQISPPNENVVIEKRPWYERYQPVSYLVDTRSGNEIAFRSMTRKCNSLGVRIYADAVINHMSATNGRGTAGSISDYNNRKYPAVPYNSEDFHQICALNNYNNVVEVRNCELVGLPDLNHSRENVRNKIVEYMNHLIDLGVAGFRIDAAKHIWPEDLKKIFKKLKNLNTEDGFASNTKPFIYQEVTQSEGIKGTDYTDLGSVTEFKYSSSISRVFQGDDKLVYLDSFGEGWGMIDRDLKPIIFVDNHDTQREPHKLTYKKSKQYKMANAFMLAHPYGLPKVMSSFYFDSKDQGPPQDTNQNLISPKINPDNTCGNGFVCEHRWRQIYNMVEFRRVVGDAPLTNWWSNGDQQISFCRGKKGFIVLTNWGDIKRKLQTCLKKGRYCDVISGELKNGKCSGKVLEVNDNGEAEVTLLTSDFDGVQAIHEKSKLE